MVITAPGNNKTTIYITDVLGKTIMQKTEQLVSGDNTVSLNVAHLAPGNYTLKAVSTNKQQTIVKKFVKQ